MKKCLLDPLAFSGFTALLLAGSHFGSHAALAQSSSSFAPVPTAVVLSTNQPLPDAPDFTTVLLSSSSDADQAAGTNNPQQPTNPQQPNNLPQPAKRLFFIIPNFRSVNTNTVLPPQTLGQKFSDASKDTFDYSSFVLEFLLAAYNYGLNNTPEFGSGGLGYSRYLWHAAADQSIENYMVEFIVPALTHEDTRFYQLGHGGFAHRTIYSLTRTFITKSDSDHATINAGEIFGAAGAAGISQLYYPRPERTFGKWAGQYGTNLAIDAASFFLREFEPEITHVVTRRKQVPAPAATQ